ncbi:hypothetical protein [Cupriavidus necator]|nr:hypothetical protein [Cupriavidus necator]
MAAYAEVLRDVLGDSDARPDALQSAGAPGKVKASPLVREATS